MRILLIAYEWPPITAAQSLRWYYLANGLAELGVKVHVLCPHIRPVTPFRGSMHKGIVEHRVWPGPFVGLAQTLFHARSLTSTSNVVKEGWQGSFIRAVRRVYVQARRMLNQVVFPDVRTEWYPFARTAMLRLVKEHQFDVVVSSHEPGVDLLLGLLAQRKTEAPWVVDLADPLIAPYTPKWRLQLDAWFEGVVLRKSNKVILTAHQLVDSLVKRHPTVSSEKFEIIPQGGAIINSDIKKKITDTNELHLVFTGNFYSTFRNPSELAKALKGIKSDRIRLTIAGNNSAFTSLFSELDRVKLLGPIGHFEALELQQNADVLLNIGNNQSDQIPGKLFEYLVANKPIFHIRGSSTDPAEPYLKTHSCSFISDNNSASISNMLEHMLNLHACGSLCVSPQDTKMLSERYGWGARASILKQVLDGAVLNTPDIR